MSKNKKNEKTAHSSRKKKNLKRRRRFEEKKFLIQRVPLIVERVQEFNRFCFDSKFQCIEFYAFQSHNFLRSEIIRRSSLDSDFLTFPSVASSTVSVIISFTDFTSCAVDGTAFGTEFVDEVDAAVMSLRS